MKIFIEKMIKKNEYNTKLKSEIDNIKKRIRI